MGAVGREEEAVQLLRNGVREGYGRRLLEGRGDRGKDGRCVVSASFVMARMTTLVKA